MKLSSYGISEEGLKNSFKDLLVHGDHKLELVFRDSLYCIDIFIWCPNCKEFRKTSVDDKFVSTSKHDYLMYISGMLRISMIAFKNHNLDSCELVKIGKIMES